MWLAGHTYAFRSLPLEEALARLVDLGFGDVELWLGHAPSGASRAAAAIEAAGVRVRAISAGGFYAPDDTAPVRAFELASALDVARVVMCVVPSLAPRLEDLAPQHVRVAVENHWDQPLARSSEVVRAIGSRRLDSCLDTGHALAAGEEPHAFALALGRRLAHVHLKEGRLPALHEWLLGRRLRRRLVGTPEPVIPGDGDLDVPALRAALERIGFDGCVSIEHEGDSPDEALAALVARWREAKGAMRPG